MMRTLAPVVIHRATAPTYNEAGEQVGAGGETEVMTNAWRVSLKGSREFAEGRQNTVTRGAALFPPGSDVRPTDEMTVHPEIAPVRCKVVGLPFPVLCPRRRNVVKYLHVDLEAVS